MVWSTLIGMGPRLRLLRRMAQGQARHVPVAAAVGAVVGGVAAAVEAAVRVAAGAVVGRRLETRSTSRQGFRW
jgi:hypothetical protein